MSSVRYDLLIHISHHHIKTTPENWPTVRFFSYISNGNSSADQSQTSAWPERVSIRVGKQTTPSDGHSSGSVGHGRCRIGSTFSTWRVYALNFAFRHGCRADLHCSLIRWSQRWRWFAYTNTHRSTLKRGKQTLSCPGPRLVLVFHITRRRCRYRFADSFGRFAFSHLLLHGRAL